MLMINLLVFNLHLGHFLSSYCQNGMIKVYAISSNCCFSDLESI